MIKINKDDNNTYNFSLNTTSGNALLYSVGFASEEEIKNVVSGLNTFDKQQYIFERKTDHNGNFLFNLKDRRDNSLAIANFMGLRQEWRMA